MNTLRITRSIAQQHAAQTHAQVVIRRVEVFKTTRAIKRIPRGRGMSRGVLQQLGLLDKGD